MTHFCACRRGKTSPLLIPVLQTRLNETEGLGHLHLRGVFPSLPPSEDSRRLLDAAGATGLSLLLEVK